MIKEIADAAGIEPVVIYSFLGLLLIAIVYGINEKIGIVLALLAIVTILTSEWKK